MNKKTICVLLAGTVLISLTACGKPAIPVQSEFTGVTRATEETADPYDGYKTICVYLNGTLIGTRDFNASGKMTQEKVLGDEGYDIRYSYDDSDNLIKDEKFGLDGKSLGGYEYEYNPSGDMISKAYVNSDGSTGSRHSYEYDPAHRMTKDTEYDADGNTKQWINFEYDVLGNILVQKQSDPSGNSFEIRNIYEYSEFGDITKSSCYRGGELSDSAEYEYDASGNRTSEKLFKADGSVKSWCTFEYNDSGHLIKKTVLKEDGSVFQSVTYDRDSLGNLVVETKFDSSGETFEMYQYVFYY